MFPPMDLESILVDDFSLFCYYKNPHETVGHGIWKEQKCESLGQDRSYLLQDKPSPGLFEGRAVNLHGQWNL